MKNEIEQRSRRPHASTQTSPTSDEESGDNAPSSAPSSAESPKGDEISGTAEKEGEIGQETKSSINTEAQVVSLKAQVEPVHTSNCVDGEGALVIVCLTAAARVSHAVAGRPQILTVLRMTIETWRCW